MENELDVIAAETAQINDGGNRDNKIAIIKAALERAYALGVNSVLAPREAKSVHWPWKPRPTSEAPESPGSG